MKQGFNMLNQIQVNAVSSGVILMPGVKGLMADAVGPDATITQIL
jgi:hypothetical protein